MDYETERFEVDYHAGWLIITDKEKNRNECVQLTNNKGRNITLSQFKSSVKTGGIDKACTVFLKLAATHKPNATACYS